MLIAGYQVITAIPDVYLVEFPKVYTEWNSPLLKRTVLWSPNQTPATRSKRAQLAAPPINSSAPRSRKGVLSSPSTSTNEYHIRVVDFMLYFLSSDFC